LVFFSKKRNSLYWFIAILFLSSLFFSYNYSIDDIWVYLIPCYYFLSIFTALGFERLYDWWVEKQKKPQIVYATVLIPLAFLFINFNRADMSRQNQSQLEVEADLAVIQQNAIIINPDYDNYEYFKYYLLGEDYEKKRNIHLMSEYEAQNYLADPENPYKVYAISQEEAENLLSKDIQRFRYGMIFIRSQNKKILSVHRNDGQWGCVLFQCIISGWLIINKKGRDFDSKSRRDFLLKEGFIPGR